MDFSIRAVCFNKYWFWSALPLVKPKWHIIIFCFTLAFLRRYFRPLSRTARFGIRWIVHTFLLLCPAKAPKNLRCCHDAPTTLSRGICNICRNGVWAELRWLDILEYPKAVESWIMDRGTRCLRRCMGSLCSISTWSPPTPRCRTSSLWLLGRLAFFHLLPHDDRAMDHPFKIRITLEDFVCSHVVGCSYQFASDHSQMGTFRCPHPLCCVDRNDRNYSLGIRKRLSEGN